MRVRFARSVLASAGLLLALGGRADAVGVSEVSNLANLYGNGATLNFTTSVRAGVFTTGPTSASWTVLPWAKSTPMGVSERALTV